MSNFRDAIYRSSSGEKSNLIDALEASAVYVVLATTNYLADVERGDWRVTDEIAMMKALKRPVIIAWVLDGVEFGVQLDEAGRDKLRVVFKDFPQVREAEFDTMNPRKSMGIIAAIKESLKD